MRIDDILVALDIGSATTTAIIAELNQESRLEILGIGQAISTGLRKGAVINIEATLKSVETAIEEAEQMAGREVSDLVTGIGGSHIEGVNSRGVVAVTSKGKEISQIDVDRVIEAARAIMLPMDREIIHVLPQEYIVDNQGGIKNPIDMIGVRLEAEVHIITGSVTTASNLVKCINRTGFSVNAIILQALASAASVLSDDEKNLGSLLIDIGAGTTDFILYQDGAPAYTNVLPLGGNEITNDISIILKTPFEAAEQMKLEAGSALAELIEPGGEPVILPGVGGRPPLAVDRNMLAQYIQPRAEEILTMVKQKVSEDGHFSQWDSLGGGIVLTGGGAMLSGMRELAARVFRTSCRLGYPIGIDNLGKEYHRADMAGPIGLLVQHLCDLGEDETVTGTAKSEKSSKIGGFRKWLKNFF